MGRFEEESKNYELKTFRNWVEKAPEYSTDDIRDAMEHDTIFYRKQLIDLISTMHNTYMIRYFYSLISQFAKKMNI